jgi:hypothetical protein
MAVFVYGLPILFCNPWNLGIHVFNSRFGWKASKSHDIQDREQNYTLSKFHGVPLGTTPHMELEWCQNWLFWSQFADTIMVSSLMALHDGVILTPWNLESSLIGNMQRVSRWVKQSILPCREAKSPPGPTPPADNCIITWTNMVPYHVVSGYTALKRTEVNWAKYWIFSKMWM